MHHIHIFSATNGDSKMRDKRAYHNDTFILLHSVQNRMLDVYIFSMVLPGCYLFPAIYCYFSFSFCALACISSESKYIYLLLYYIATPTLMLMFALPVRSSMKRRREMVHPMKEQGESCLHLHEL